MGAYDTYYKGPVLVGSANDNIAAKDEGSVVLSQFQTIALSSGAGTGYFQIPPYIRLKEIYLDFAVASGQTGATPTAGTYTVAYGTTNTVAGTPLLLANAVAITTTSPRTLAGYANNDPAAWALVINSGANTWMRITIAGLTPTTITNLGVIISYAIYPTS